MEYRMDENIAKDINRLKENLYRQKEQAANVEALIKKEIDREFPMNLWDLSEKELDAEMGDRLTFLNNDIDPRPDLKSITSHRKILGKPIVLLKRLIMKIAGVYTNSLLEKQRRFNDQLVAFHLASFIRFRNNEKNLKFIDEKLKNLEEDREMLREQLDNFEKKLSAGK